MTAPQATMTAGAVSVGLHVALLLSWGARAPQAPSPEPKPLPVEVEVMRLAGVVAPRPRPASTGAEREPLAPSRLRPRSVLSAAATLPRVEEHSPALDGPTENPGPAPEEEREAPPAPARAGAAAAEGASATSEAGGNLAHGPLELDTSDLSRRLQEGARRCYPPAARRFGQLGVTQLRFCLDATGAVKEASVTASSGFESLDRAARECVVPGAAPFSLETFGRCFTLPVRFRQ